MLGIFSGHPGYNSGTEASFLSWFSHWDQSRWILPPEERVRLGVVILAQSASEIRFPTCVESLKVRRRRGLNLNI